MPEHLPPDEFASTHLEQTLPTIREPLFTMTDRILDDAGERDWNLIVGDDTNGRMPTYFVRKALHRARGYRTPTVFVNASAGMRATLRHHDYAEYVASALDPSETYRPLIVTESVGAGSALTALKTALEDGATVESVDAAAIASRANKPEFLRYIGSEGNEALVNVFFCLEAIAGTSLKARALTRMRQLIPQGLKDAMPEQLHMVGRPKVSGSVLTGLYSSPDAVLPLSEADHIHHLAPSYRALDPLLDEYAESRGLQAASHTSTTSVIIR